MPPSLITLCHYHPHPFKAPYVCSKTFFSALISVSVDLPPEAVLSPDLLHFMYHISSCICILTVTYIKAHIHVNMS